MKTRVISLTVPVPPEKEGDFPRASAFKRALVRALDEAIAFYNNELPMLVPAFDVIDAEDERELRQMTEALEAAQAMREAIDKGFRSRAETQ